MNCNSACCQGHFGDKRRRSISCPPVRPTPRFGRASLTGRGLDGSDGSLGRCFCGCMCRRWTPPLWEGTMQSKKTIAVRAFQALTAFSALLVGGAGNAFAQTEAVLYSFQGSPDGKTACCGMPVLDKAGNIYGTTLYGGANNLGTVWK